MVVGAKITISVREPDNHVNGVHATELVSLRLSLRPLQARDAPALSAYRSRPEVARHQPWETFTEG